MLASIAGLVSPVFNPMGFGDWRIVTSLISGFMAKESVVSTLTVLFRPETMLATVLTGVSAYALLVFCLLYTPCIATIATVRHEMGNSYALILVVWQCFIAWVCSFAAFVIGSLII
jgi:ferrous iron transport protein B